MSDDADLPQKLRIIFSHLRLTPNDIAGKIEKHPSTVRRWLNGAASPPLIEIDKIFSLFNLPISIESFMDYSPKRLAQALNMGETPVKYTSAQNNSIQWEFEHGDARWTKRYTTEFPGFYRVFYVCIENRSYLTEAIARLYMISPESMYIHLRSGDYEATLKTTAVFSRALVMLGESITKPEILNGNFVAKEHSWQNTNEVALTLQGALGSLSPTHLEYTPSIWIKSGTGNEEKWDEFQKKIEQRAQKRNEEYGPFSYKNGWSVSTSAGRSFPEDENDRCIALALDHLTTEYYKTREATRPMVLPFSGRGLSAQ